MKKFVATCLLICACTGAFARAKEDTSDPNAVAQIADIVRAFQAAIIAHDGDKLESMFYPAGGSWLSVASDTAKLHPGEPRVRSSTYLEFAQFVRSVPKPVEERFYNVRIQSNGSIGTVYFDFDFLIDGKVTNKGSESWHLLRTASGWKINSMVYSNG